MRLALGTALLLATQVTGPDVAARISAAKAALENLEYETAADELMIAATDPRATLDERVDANLYAGIANRVLHRDVDARLNFTFVLKHRPEQKLPPNTPPKITAFYELVRQEVELTRGPAPTATTPVASEPAAPDTAPVAAATPAPESLQTEPVDEQPAPAEVDDGAVGGIGWQIVTGSGLLAVGIGALGVAAVVAATGELLLAIPSADAGLKSAAQVAGLSALAIAALPSLLALGGAGLVVWGIIE